MCCIHCETNCSVVFSTNWLGAHCAVWRVSGSDILSRGGSVIKLSRFCPEHRLCLSITALCLLCTGGSPICLGKVPPSNERPGVATNFTFITHRWKLREGQGKEFRKIRRSNRWYIKMKQYPDKCYGFKKQ